MENDIAWAVAGGLQNKEKRMLLLGAWTSFRKETTIENMKNLKLITCQRFPKVQNILFVKHIKIYQKVKIHFSVDFMEVYIFVEIFVNADEQVYYAGILHIWKLRDLYSKMILVMGRFSSITCFSESSFQTLQLFGFARLVDSGAIAAGSVGQAFEGRHY